MQTSQEGLLKAFPRHIIIAIASVLGATVWYFCSALVWWYGFRPFSTDGTSCTSPYNIGDFGLNDGSCPDGGHWYVFHPYNMAGLVMSLGVGFAVAAMVLGLLALFTFGTLYDRGLLEVHISLKGRSLFGNCPESYRPLAIHVPFDDLSSPEQSLLRGGAYTPPWERP
jgi:hypothetical protein